MSYTAKPLSKTNKKASTVLTTLCGPLLLIPMLKTSSKYKKLTDANRKGEAIKHRNEARMRTDGRVPDQFSNVGTALLHRTDGRILYQLAQWCRYSPG